MTDIHVRHCTVRVVRQGGWSWGPDPRRLVDGVLQAVPALIAEALAGAVGDRAGAVIGDPVRVTVPLGRSELASLAAVGRGTPGGSGHGLDGLAASLGQAVRAALAERGVPGRASPAGAARPDAAAPAVPVHRPGPGTLQLLLAWERDGVLADLLERLPGPALASWHEALLQGWGSLPGAAPAADELAAVLGGSPAPPAGPGGAMAVWLRRRLAALTVVAARTGLVPGQPEVLEMLDGRLGPAPAARARPTPQPAAGPEPERAAPPDPAAPAPAATAPSPGRPGAPTPATAGPVSPGGPARRPARPTGEIRIDSALPFLMAVPLARSGWLDTLAVAVEAAGLGDHWLALAAALAFKVLSPPEHGWRRSPEDQVAAAAFAGCGEPLVEGALPAEASLLAPALDAVLGRSLVDGHRPEAPLVLVEAGAATGDGLVLFDGEGMFPMAWADDTAGLAGWLRDCPGARVVRGPGRWSEREGDGGAEGEPRAPGAPDEPGIPDDRELIGRAGLVLEELGRRPALPLAAEPALERSLTLAAGASLAAIALTLWGDHEPTDPVLAIERLASLSAVVRNDGERVRVTVPLGARYFDLRRRGLLGVVPGLPWLDGRAVEIMGG